MQLRSVLLTCFAALCLLAGPLADSPAQARDMQDGAVAGKSSAAKKRKKKSRKKRNSQGRRQRYTVIPGDTLSKIAKKFGVKISQIKAWNKLSSNSLSVGKKLTIYSSRHVRSRSKTLYTVRRGETLAKIAKKRGVKTGDILAWNPKVDPRRIRPGTKLRIYTLAPAGGGSVGTANSGKLHGGVILGSGPGYRVRSSSRAYGTGHTVNLISQCISETKRRFPKARTIMIGDLSFKHGGYMRPHKSHQSGRDADISYYIKKTDTSHRFIDASARTLDVAKTWYLFDQFLQTGQVEYIFVDYPLQKVLYEHAKKKGVPSRRLEQVFQYPRGRGARQGVIRYSRGHDDHFHIRFKCPPDQKSCK
jgi:LysM repeat protein